MRRLFLSSAGIVPETREEFCKLLGRDLRGLTVAFIPTAADPVSDKTFVQWSLDQIAELEMRLLQVDLKEQDADGLYSKLKPADIVWVNGGDTSYLLKQVRRSGFDRAITRLLDEGKVYVGVSAGSYIASPNIEAPIWKTSGANCAKGGDDLTALGLVDFMLVVHYEDQHKKAVADGAKSANCQVIALTDQQAIVVNGEDYRVVGEGEIHVF